MVPVRFRARARAALDAWSKAAGSDSGDTAQEAAELASVLAAILSERSVEYIGTKQIAASFGVHISSVCNWYRRYDDWPQPDVVVGDTSSRQVHGWSPDRLPEWAAWYDQKKTQWAASHSAPKSQKKAPAPRVPKQPVEPGPEEERWVRYWARCTRPGCGHVYAHHDPLPPAACRECPCRAFVSD
jgi:hypothetical protein